MTRVAAAAAAASALVVCTALPLSASAGSAGTTSVRETAATGLYRKAPTVACVRRARADVTAIAPADKRLRALRDLAQKTSWQAKRGADVVGVSINRTSNDAQLLIELLRVPRDRYRLERKANAVLLYVPSSRALASAVRACLA